MPRKRGEDRATRRGPKTDDAAASKAPPPAIAPMKQPSRSEKVRGSKLAKKTTYGGRNERRGTS